ncbi:L-lactate permease [Leucobacter denitrificans]|uniref:L-lactate permease n=2 Tax=Leucobacter denitrificans TaxID=683042 RepID=A0A7G9S6Z9_9MICO|nr:L-lactate permease [Leucobacter denitrificans]
MLLLLIRVPALYAISATIVLTLILAWEFPLRSAVLTESLPSTLELSITLALIMFGGIALANLLHASGAQKDINTWLNRLVVSPERAALFYGLVLVPLIESLVGWGLGVITGIPMLLGTGLSKLKAIQIALLGMMLCPWGAFAPSLIVASDFTGFSQTTIGTVTAFYNVPVIFILAISILVVHGGAALRVKMWIECLATASMMGITLIAVNAFVAPSLAGVLASLGAAVILVLFARRGQQEYHPPTALAVRGMMPYVIVLVGLALSTILAAFVGPSTYTKLLTNPATWLTVAVAFTPLLVRMASRDTWSSLASSTRAWGPAFSVTLLFVLFGVLLSLNGMGTSLAEGIALLGGAFAVLVPISGFIAGFVTSSNTASAAMLAGPLNVSASGLGLDSVHAVSVQTAASGAAVMCSPARAEVSRQTANLLSPGGDEGVTVARILSPALLANTIIVALLAGLGYIFF